MISFKDPEVVYFRACEMNQQKKSTRSFILDAQKVSSYMVVFSLST